MTINYRPLRNIIVVEKELDELHSAGGIRLLRPIKSKPRVGKVIAMGPGVLDENEELVTCGVEVGDRIAWDKQYEKTFEINNEYVICVLGNGVLGKVK